jgi:hypothetical protein
MCLEMKKVEKQGMSEYKKHTYVLFVDLTFAYFFASYSYAANDRKLVPRHKAACYVLLPCGTVQVFSIPARTLRGLG